MSDRGAHQALLTSLRRLDRDRSGSCEEGDVTRTFRRSRVVVDMGTLKAVLKKMDTSGGDLPVTLAPGAPRHGPGRVPGSPICADSPVSFVYAPVISSLAGHHTVNFHQLEDLLTGSTPGGATAPVQPPDRETTVQAHREQYRAPANAQPPPFGAAYHDPRPNGTERQGQPRSGSFVAEVSPTIDGTLWHHHSTTRPPPLGGTQRMPVPAPPSHPNRHPDPRQTFHGSQNSRGGDPYYAPPRAHPDNGFQGPPAGFRSDLEGQDAEGWAPPPQGLPTSEAWIDRFGRLDQALRKIAEHDGTCDSATLMHKRVCSPPCR